MIPISKLGEKQLQDIRNSKSFKMYNNYTRLCTIIKKDDLEHNRKDRSPYRMEELFCNIWQNYNIHYVLQIAFCPFSCKYCYVDNKKVDTLLSVKELVQDYFKFKRKAKLEYNINVNVLHVMGGNPGMYSYLWPEIRKEMDSLFLYNDILFSDVLLVEEYLYGIKPWQYMNMHHTLITGCLKGNTEENFKQNTGKNLYKEALQELQHYKYKDNFYLTLINTDLHADYEDIYNILPKDKIDFLEVVPYIACRKY